jgi:hypothetical protein
MSCDPEGTFLLVATVGPYVLRLPLPGAGFPATTARSVIHMARAVR